MFFYFKTVKLFSKKYLFSIQYMIINIIIIKYLLKSITQNISFGIKKNFNLPHYDPFPKGRQ